MIFPPRTLAALVAGAGLALASADLATAGVRDLLGSPGACFARVYSPSHMRNHQRQTLTFFYLKAGPMERQNVARGDGFIVDFGFRVAARADTYRGVGVCSNDGASVRCDIEGEGGSFQLTQVGDGLRVDIRRIQLEGEHDFAPEVGPGDDRVVLLSRARPGACQ